MEGLKDVTTPYVDAYQMASRIEAVNDCMHGGVRSVLGIDIPEPLASAVC